MNSEHKTWWKSKKLESIHSQDISQIISTPLFLSLSFFFFVVYFDVSMQNTKSYDDEKIWFQQYCGLPILHLSLSMIVIRGNICSRFIDSSVIQIGYVSIFIRISDVHRTHTRITLLRHVSVRLFLRLTYYQGMKATLLSTQKHRTYRAPNYLYVSTSSSDILGPRMSYLAN